MPSKDRQIGDGLGVIYCVTNIATGVKYIGQTRYPAKTRWYAHVASANRGHNTRLAKAIRKYGKAGFIIEELERVPVCDLDREEQRYIAQFKTLSPHGYNLTSGGQSISRVCSKELTLRNQVAARKVINFPIPEWVEDAKRKREQRRQRISQASLSYWDNLPPDVREAKKAELSAQGKERWRVRQSQMAA